MKNPPAGERLGSLVDQELDGGERSEADHRVAVRRRPPTAPPGHPLVAQACGLPRKWREREGAAAPTIGACPALPELPSEIRPLVQRLPDRQQDYRKAIYYEREYRLRADCLLPVGSCELPRRRRSPLPSVAVVFASPDLDGTKRHQLRGRGVAADFRARPNCNRMVAVECAPRDVPNSSYEAAVRRPHRTTRGGGERARRTPLTVPAKFPHARPIVAAVQHGADPRPKG